jgi:integrase
MCGKAYLRPAAVAAGVISEADHSRFGWHNLRHSLATFFGSNDVHPSVIQTVLRHAKQQTTTRYIHSVNDKQLEAQGLYLDAIKIRKKCPQPSGRRRLRVESRVGGKSTEYVTT